MNITDLLKKVSLVAAVSALALPAYASLSVEESDVAAQEVDGPKITVVNTATSGPFTLSITDTTTGEGDLEKTKRKMTMTQGVVEKVVFKVEDFSGSHSYLTMGEGEFASSNGLFDLGAINFNFGAAIEDPDLLGELVEAQLTSFLANLADTKENALAEAEKKALAKKELAEAEEALTEKLAEEGALNLEEKPAVAVEEEKAEAEEKPAVAVEEEKAEEVVGDEL